MSKHSSIVGGSTVDRLLHCPGSFQLIQRLPEQVEAPSEYANYGTAMHAVMDRLMAMYADGLPPDEDIMVQAAEEMLGETFYDRVLEPHHIDDSIMPAIDTLYDLMDAYAGGGGYRVVANELRVKFPNIPGAFGTTDLLLANTKHIIMVDWKFGQGVPVSATYKDEHGERVNPQLMFYFAGVMEELPKSVFDKKRFIVAVIQPRTEERLTHTQITRLEVTMFIEDVYEAISKALNRNPELNIGEYCRWCPARPSCPEHTKPLFDLVELEIMPAQLKASVAEIAGQDDPSYGVFLAKAKYLADLAAEYKKHVDEAMHAYLENGGTVPGWRLKLKTKLRQWVNETEAAGWMLSEGFESDEIWQTKLQTFAVVDKVAKRRGVKIPDHFRVAPPTEETTLARTDDPAPVVDRKAAALELQEALKKIASQ